MSNLKSWLLVFFLAAICAGCGGGDGGGDPDASTPDGMQPLDPDGGRIAVDASESEIPPCETYCNAITANCTGANAQYPDLGTCLSLCASVDWDAGEAGAQTGNTLACRTYHAGAPAADDPVANCPQAGPSGNDVCGTWCEVYCGLNLKTCTGSNAQYGSEGECLSACATFKDTGTAGDDMGDTVQCRIYHSGYPALRDPAAECSYAGEQPGNYCIDFISF